MFVLFSRTSSNTKVLFSNIQYPSVIEQNQLFYYNSGQFYKRDLVTNKVEKLNKDVNTQPKATNVLWSKTGVLFQTQGYDPFGPTSSYMSQQGYNVTRPYWWYLNFQTGSIVLLGEGQKNQQYSNVVWENTGQSILTTSFATGTQSNSNIISFHTIGLGNKDTVIKSDVNQNYNTIWYGDNSILASYAERLVRVDLRDFSETPILTNLNASRYTASADGQQIAYILADDNTKAQAARTESASLKGELRIYDQGTQKNKIIKKDYYGNMVFSQSLSVFNTYASAVQDSTTHTDVMSFTLQNISSDSFDTQTSLNSLTLLSYSPFSALITDNQDNMRSVGKPLPSNITANGNPGYLDTKALSQPRANVSYQDNNNKTLTIVAFSQADLNNAYATLQQKMGEQGYDLSTMSTKWVVIPGRQ